MEDGPVNPYQSPLASLTGELVEPEAVGARPAYKLFSKWSVFIATLLGSPLAGGIVMAVNYRRLGDREKAVYAVVWTAVATAAIIGLGIFFPDVPNALFLAPQLAGMYLVAKMLQGPAIERHEARGGRRDSGWVAAGVGVLCGIAIFAVIVGGAVVFGG